MVLWECYVPLESCGWGWGHPFSGRGMPANHSIVLLTSWTLFPLLLLFHFLVVFFFALFLRQFLFVAAFSSAHNYLYALLSVSVCLLCLFAFFKFFICFGMGQICCQYLYKGSRKGKNGQRKILLHHSSHLKCSQLASILVMSLSYSVNIKFCVLIVLWAWSSRRWNFQSAATLWIQHT